MRKNNDSEGRKVRIFLTVAVVAVMAGVAVFTTSAAFTATTSNPGNQIEAGTVAIGDSDASTGVLYNALNQKPGSGNGPTAACIRVTLLGLARLGGQALPQRRHERRGLPPQGRARQRPHAPRRRT